MFTDVPWKANSEPSGISSISFKALGTGHYSGVLVIRYVSARIILLRMAKDRDRSQWCRVYSEVEILSIEQHSSLSI